jgi:alkanesulfonate monooxygenase SsuD/methylene tetrahydromethanopterin reductase-like flavin-dependent oxidoreductase (luciferase family)
MRYGVDVPTFGEYGDPRRLAELARLAEDTGWDGFFVWDHVTFIKERRYAIADPWVALTAVALATERIRLGTLVTPVARRRPSTLARQTVTLDRLSGGRLVLGVGLGAPIEDEYGTFGEPTDAKVLAERLDEGLEVLTGLWSGQPFGFRGAHLVADDVAFQPTPVQQPRIPIWVAGCWPHRPPFRRAARWDGMAPLLAGDSGRLRPPTAAEVREMVEFVARHRSTADPFDVVVIGGTPADDVAAARATAEATAEAGATWWVEGFEPEIDSFEYATARVRAGPPR